MKPQRRLALKRESLADLVSDELRDVVGGTHIRTDCGCITHGNTCDACNVLTLPINDCVRRVTTVIVVELTDACVSPTRICA